MHVLHVYIAFMRADHACTQVQYSYAMGACIVTHLEKQDCELHTYNMYMRTVHIHTLACSLNSRANVKTIQHMYIQMCTYSTVHAHVVHIYTCTAYFQEVCMHTLICISTALCTHETCTHVHHTPFQTECSSLKKYLEVPEEWWLMYG